MKTFANTMVAMWKDESGISSVEYALLLAFVAAGIILSAEILANAVANEMHSAANCINGGTAGSC